MDLSSVIIRPVVTEKTAHLQDAKVKKYTMIVSSHATKTTVQRAFEKAYDTKVTSVRIMNTATKTRFNAKRQAVQKRSMKKKAIITLKSGQKPIDFLTGEKK